MLCGVCLGIFQHRNEFYDGETVRPYNGRAWNLSPNRQWSFGHHLTTLSLKQSSILGCYICNALWEKFSKDDQGLMHAWYEKDLRSRRIGSGKAGVGQANTLTWNDFSTVAQISTYEHNFTSFSLLIEFDKPTFPGACYRRAFFPLYNVNSMCVMIHTYPSLIKS
jgi:hypothetical protein